MSDKKSSSVAMIFFFAFLTIFLVIADQFIKRAVSFKMNLYDQIVVIPNFFSIYFCVNTGSAFSFLADKTWGIYVLSCISLVIGTIILLLMFVAVQNRMKLLSVTFCLISAGAYGNLIDRFALKYVIDYLRFDFGTYTFPIFNFADICAVVGTFLFVFVIFFGKDEFDNFWNAIRGIFKKNA
ncbi:MAG: signal peptidase II [Saccharofermentans sp.]|nr:signal peptidase II [Saccharofermentans sp.]